MRGQRLASIHGPDVQLAWYVGELDEEGAVYWVCEHRHSSDLEALGCAYTALEYYRLIEDKGQGK
jgi:hypothetical protein